MTLRRALLTVALAASLGAAPATAQQPDAEALAQSARAASDQLENASLALQQAVSARDRVRALTETVKAYEAGLAAMRDGLRRAATREAMLERKLQAREGEIARLLGVIQVIGTAPPPVLMLHPSGPMGAARSGMMLADVTPGLTAQAADLRRDLTEVRTLRQLQQSAAQTLEDGLAGVQTARAELSQAVADRTDLPLRFVEDPVRTAILLSSTETLDAFASGLSEIASGPVAETNADITAQKGDLALPVEGVVLRRAGEADAGGIRRPGIVLATRPRALVTTPTAATVRYRGPLLDLGNVVILEPQANLLFVLSGLSDVYGAMGEVLPAGSPVGLMGGATPGSGAILSLSGDGTGTDRSETLYMEVREAGSPVDPETWFRTDKDG
ncbi:murein hydrolase activator EnvC family protein [Arenibacterium halophilum]|uniref:Peptidase M23 n=1 Tax=Arenibacterium halophilum TaxID=2583821 RepID=A0ABY2XFY4_9RHOB|nr:peptidoglycan DD-metalloendopeptidase family protein [Arenibacterium halophilum]TMV15646.1 peptidase M23 [Arenibacterium halophilum]